MVRTATSLWLLLILFQLRQLLLSESKQAQHKHQSPFLGRTWIQYQHWQATPSQDIKSMLPRRKATFTSSFMMELDTTWWQLSFILDCKPEWFMIIKYLQSISMEKEQCRQLWELMLACFHQVSPRPFECQRSQHNLQLLWRGKHQHKLVGVQ